MNVYDVAAMTIHSNGDMIEGRTAMQKLIYFNSVKIPSINMRPYTHHFYGPFSREVATALEEMSALSYLNEVSRSGFYDVYAYLLTTKGKKYADHLRSKYPEEFAKIADIVAKCREFCQLKPKPLSYAAKAHYILANTEMAKDRYGPDDVQRVAEDFDWNISTDDVKTGMSLLQELGLVRT